MSNTITPSLESVTVKAKYSIAGIDFLDIKKRLYNYVREVRDWKVLSEIGSLIIFSRIPATEELGAYLKKKRPGLPVYLSLAVLEKLSDRLIVEIECRPAMWYRISNLQEEEFTENQVQQALMEVKVFVKQTMRFLRKRKPAWMPGQTN